MSDKINSVSSTGGPSISQLPDKPPVKPTLYQRLVAAGKWVWNGAVLLVTTLGAWVGKTFTRHKTGSEPEEVAKISDVAKKSASFTSSDEAQVSVQEPVVIPSAPEVKAPPVVIEIAKISDVARKSTSFTGSDEAQVSVQEPVVIPSAPEVKAPPVVIDLMKKHQEKLAGYLTRHEELVKDYGEHFLDFKKASDLYAETFDFDHMQINATVNVRGDNAAECERMLGADVEKLRLQIGKARDNGDCFFDSMSQVLKAAGITVTASELRGAVADYYESAKPDEIAWAKRIVDGESGGIVAWEDYPDAIRKSFDDLEPENVNIRKANAPLYADINHEVDQINELRKQIRALPPHDINRFGLEREFIVHYCEYRELIGKMQFEKLVLWGAAALEGQVIADKYGVNVQVHEVLQVGEDKRVLSDPKLIKPKSGPATHTVHIGYYPQHFIPLLPSTLIA